MSNEVKLETIDQESRILSALGYIPLLFWLPIITRRKEEFAQFHAKQSLVLFLAMIILWVFIGIASFIIGKILGNIFLIGFLFRFIAWIINKPIGSIVSLLYLISIVAGAVNALTGKFWRVPIIGSYAERFPNL